MIVHYTDNRGVWIGSADVDAKAPMPAGAYLDSPPPVKVGFSIVRTSDHGWDYVAVGSEPAPLVTHRALQYMPLHPLEFEKLLQDVGGITDAQLVAISKDVNIAPLWLKLTAFGVTEIHLKDATTQAGLQALVTLTYYDQAHHDAVVAAWPMG